MIELLLQAERALAVGLVDQAERLYRQAIAADPRNSIAVVGLARVALEHSDDAEAYRRAKQALQIDPENVAANRLVRRLEEIHAPRAIAAPPAPAAPSPVPAAPPAAPPLPAPEAEPLPEAEPSPAPEIEPSPAPEPARDLTPEPQPETEPNATPEIEPAPAPEIEPTQVLPPELAAPPPPATTPPAPATQPPPVGPRAAEPPITRRPWAVAESEVEPPAPVRRRSLLDRILRRNRA